VPQKLEFWFVGTTLKKHCTTGEKKMNLKTRLKIKKEFVNLERNCNFKRESRKWKAKDFDTFVKDGEGGWVLLCLESGKKIS
jgi:hypothetical protein